jgi:hypothetical protein
MPGIAAEKSSESIPQQSANASFNIKLKHLRAGNSSSQHNMSWIENYRRRSSEKAQQSEQNQELQFRNASHERWRLLGEELKSDVAEFDAQQQQADFSSEGENLYRVRNSASGLELTLHADFDNSVVRYEYSAINDHTAGVPEGGILSIRKSSRGSAEFYTADERLTSEETRQVLLEPVLFPPQRAA